MVAPAGPGPRRRQARGERRIAVLLDVAAQVFADVGFEAATTNTIAARAGMSPGSLYQFFANKDAIAEALTARYVEQLRATQAEAFAPDVAHLSLDALIDRVVDPLVAFHLAHPGFQALFLGSEASSRLAAATQQLHQAVLSRVEAILAARAPALPPERRARSARVSVQLFKGLLPLVLAAEPAERAAVIGELKAVLRGYLAPIDGVAAPAGSPRSRGVGSREGQAEQGVGEHARG